jgi:hypothetical protein
MQLRCQLRQRNIGLLIFVPAICKLLKDPVIITNYTEEKDKLEIMLKEVLVDQHEVLIRHRTVLGETEENYKFSLHSQYTC